MNNRRGQNDHRSSQPRGGVGGHGMSGRLEEISAENFAGGLTSNVRFNSAQAGKAGTARGAVGSVHSSEEGRNETGAKGPNLNTGDSVARDQAMAPLLGIKTPIEVQALQRTLYRKAKENRRWRAWSLYGDLCRRDVLETAMKAVVANAGAAGIDGITTEQVKAGSEKFLHDLQAQLKEGCYLPGPVKCVWIDKAEGKQRPLGVPNRLLHRRPPVGTISTLAPSSDPCLAPIVLRRMFSESGMRDIRLSGSMRGGSSPTLLGQLLPTLPSFEEWSDENLSSQRMNNGP